MTPYSQRKNEGGCLMNAGYTLSTVFLPFSLPIDSSSINRTTYSGEATGVKDFYSTVASSVAASAATSTLGPLEDVVPSIGRPTWPGRGLTISLPPTVSIKSGAETNCPPGETTHHYYWGCRLLCFERQPVDFDRNNDNRQIIYVHGPIVTEISEKWGIKKCTSPANQAIDPDIMPCEDSKNCIWDQTQGPFPEPAASYVEYLLSGGHATPPTSTEPPPQSTTDMIVWWFKKGAWVFGIGFPLFCYLKKFGATTDGLVRLRMRCAEALEAGFWRPFGTSANNGYHPVDPENSGPEAFEMMPLSRPESRGSNEGGRDTPPPAYSPVANEAS